MTDRRVGLPTKLDKNLLPIGLLLAALLWLVESLVDTYVFREDGLASSLFLYGDLHEFLDRTAIAVGLIAFIAYLQRVMNRRAQTEEQLRRSEERFRALVQNASDVVTALDADGTIRYEGPAIERVLGYRPDELVGKHIFDYLHPEDKGRVLDKFVRALEEGMPTASEEFRFRHKDGSWRHLEGIGSNQLRNPAIRGVVINSRDITERKRAEEELARALRAKSDFMADASHELRAPLTVLQGEAEAGLQIGCSCTHRERLVKVINQSRRISRLVEDLLFLARSDSGTLPLDLRVVSIETFLAELATLAEGLAREQGSSLRTALSGEGWLRIDVERIEQAVLALVDNAAKYSRGGQIGFTATTRSRELCIEIADRGPGIPEEELPLIFERFYRSSRTHSRGQTGSGLGLPIAKTLAEVHHGRIEVASRANEGTTMMLCLPLVERSGPPLDPAPGDPRGF